MSGNRSKSAFFEGGWVTLSADFRGKGASPTNHCWYQKTTVIAVSCGIKIFAVHCLVLSQYTHLTDRQTDGQTELRQQYRALHYMQSHGKNWNVTLSITFRSTGALAVCRSRRVDICQGYRVVGAPHQWRGQETCVWGRARVTIVCVLQMQC